MRLSHVYPLEGVGITLIHPCLHLICVDVECDHLQVVGTEIQLTAHQIHVILRGGKSQFGVEPGLLELGHRLPGKFILAEMVDLQIEQNLLFGTPGNPTKSKQPLGRVYKTTIDQILRRVLILLQNNSFIFELFHIDTRLQHLVIDRKYVQFALLLVPSIAVCGFERELLVGVVALDHSHHFFYFVLVDVQHAESGRVELE